MHNRVFRFAPAWGAAAIAASVVLAAQPIKVESGGDPVRIEVLGEWGDAPRENVQKTLCSAAAQLLRFCPERRLGTITVRHHEGVPMTLYEKGPQGQHQVLLGARNTYWCQYAYQFSHEVGHILCNCDRRKEGRNHWFEETLCETASLFAMRRMATAWKTDPPYANWADFAPRLDQYVDSILAGRDRRLPPDRTMPQWFLERAEVLAGQRHPTPDSQLVAAYLLALFEDEPKGVGIVGLDQPWPQGRRTRFPRFPRKLEGTRSQGEPRVRREGPAVVRVPIARCCAVWTPPDSRTVAGMADGRPEQAQMVGRNKRRW